MAQTREGPRFLELPDWKAVTDNGNASAPEAGTETGSWGDGAGEPRPGDEITSVPLCHQKDNSNYVPSSLL